MRIGICSWADEGLVRAWYPRGVSTGERRLRYYAERFDVVEVDSPYYALPDPAVTERWARRTPDPFTFHVKASAAMTGHDGEPTDEAFRLFRAALGPLELSGKLRGVLLQYPPGFVKSPEALAELELARGRLEPLVPLIEFRHRSWMLERERAHTLEFLRGNGLAYVSVDSPATSAANVLPRLAARTHEVAYVRFHGTNGRYHGSYSNEALSDWAHRLADRWRSGQPVYAYFNNDPNADATRNAATLKRMLSAAYGEAPVRISLSQPSRNR